MLLQIIVLPESFSKSNWSSDFFQLHPGALYLLGAVYLTGDCVKKDIASALWCFHRASDKVMKLLSLLTQFFPVIVTESCCCSLVIGVCWGKLLISKWA